MVTTVRILSFLLVVFCQISLGKCSNFSLVYLPDLLYGVRGVLDFVLSCKLVLPKSAFYLVSVRQTEILPLASFR